MTWRRSPRESWALTGARLDTNGQHLAETYLMMLNTHEPDLADRFVAEDNRNHNASVVDGREANRQFWA